MAEPGKTEGGATGAGTQAKTNAEILYGPQMSAEVASQRTAESVAVEKSNADVLYEKDGTEEQAGEGERPEAKDTETEAAPYDLRLPEGTFVDQPLLNEFTVWARENDFTDEQAQRAADLHLKSIAAYNQRLQDDARQQVKAWGDEITNDKELGGARVQETVAAAEKLFSLAETVPGMNLARFKADLVRTGMANHPDLIRVARYIGTHVGDDNLFIADRSSGGGPTKSDAEVLYPGHR